MLTYKNRECTYCLTYSFLIALLSIREARDHGTLRVLDQISGNETNNRETERGRSVTYSELHGRRVLIKEEERMSHGSARIGHDGLKAELIIKW